LKCKVNNISGNIHFSEKILVEENESPNGSHPTGIIKSESLKTAVSQFAPGYTYYEV